jgi:hypothetical protein
MSKKKSSVAHGTKISKVLKIKEVTVSRNKNSKITIVVEPSEQNPRGVFQLTPKHLNNLAEKCGAVNGRMLRNAMVSGLSDNYFSCEFTWNEKGNPVLDSDGEPILDIETGKDRLFTESHWGNDNLSFILGADAKRYIARINADVDKDMVKESIRAAEADVVTVNYDDDNTSDQPIDDTEF